MYVTILRLSWPFAQRFLTKQVAEYVQKRRERRWQKRESQLSPEMPAAKLHRREAPPVQKLDPELPSSSLSAVFWYILSGICMGGTLGFLIAYIIVQDKAAQ